MAYNYQHFALEEYNFAQFPGPNVGEIAPDFEAYTLAGKPVKLSDYFGKTIVLESGSATCDIYASNIPLMNQQMQQFPAVQYLVLFVREPHPGKKLGPHQSQQDKIERAKYLKKIEPENRTILVDKLDGQTHMQYSGGVPDFVYVIGADGKVIYRDNWNVPQRISAVLAALEKNQNIDIKNIATIQNPDKTKGKEILKKLSVFHRAGKGALLDFIKVIIKVRGDRTKVGMD